MPVGSVLQANVGHDGCLQTVLELPAWSTVIPQLLSILCRRSFLHALADADHELLPH